MVPITGNNVIKLGNSELYLILNIDQKIIIKPIKLNKLLIIDFLKIILFSKKNINEPAKNSQNLANGK